MANDCEIGVMAMAKKAVAGKRHCNARRYTVPKKYCLPKLCHHLNELFSSI